MSMAAAPTPDDIYTGVRVQRVRYLSEQGFLRPGHISAAVLYVRLDRLPAEPTQKEWHTATVQNRNTCARDVTLGEYVLKHSFPIDSEPVLVDGVPYARLYVNSIEPADQQVDPALSLT